MSSPAAYDPVSEEPEQYGAEGEGAEVEARRGVAEVQLPPEEGHDRPQHRLHKREEANQAISHPGSRVPCEAGLLHELLRISTLTPLLGSGKTRECLSPATFSPPSGLGDADDGEALAGNCCDVDSWFEPGADGGCSSEEPGSSGLATVFPGPGSSFFVFLPFSSLGFSGTGGGSGLT